MTRSTDEHELVLGNKQLLSAFFVVAILLGVFFTMGYFVGRNTTTASGPDGSGKPGSAALGQSGEDSGSATAPAPPIDVDSKPAPPAVSESAPSDQAAAHVTSEQMYLQVFALRRADADNEVKVLKERGFPALIGESSKKDIFRVLVGPFKTQTEMGHTKSDLKAKGFDSIVAR